MNVPKKMITLILNLKPEMIIISVTTFDSRDGADELLSNCDSSTSCSSEEFDCLDGSNCIPKSDTCNGEVIGTCNDYSHTIADQCDNCTDDHLFLCQRKGVNYCLNVKYQCVESLVQQCEGGADMFLSKCGYSSPPCSADQFACLDGLKCVSKNTLCDFYTDCDDDSDELASQCNDCSSNEFFKCQKDGKEVCRQIAGKCDGIREHLP